MDVSHRSEETLPEPGSRGPSGESPPRPRGKLSSHRVGELLGLWQRREVQIARAFRECRGLSREQLEDIYQETALALLGRPYASEEHVRNALRTGIKHRALNLHRDARRREQILAQNAPRLQHEAGGAHDGSDSAVLIREGRLLASEFLTELSASEQRVFWLLAEGMRYRAIATTLGVPVNEARNAARSCERKRERFQLLYDTGRLCGFRSVTIKALLRGEATSAELAQRAFVHVEGCAACRAEHRTNAKRLRQSFQEQIAALLPVPALLGHSDWLARGQARLGSVQNRLRAEALPFGGGGVSERAVALLGGGGAAAKLAATAATIALVASGTIGATRVLEHRAPHHQQGRTRSAVAPGAVASTAGGAQPLAAERSSSNGSQTSSSSGAAGASNSHARHEPGGFAFLGVPAGQPLAHQQEAPRAPAQRRGGPFSP